MEDALQTFLDRIKEFAQGFVKDRVGATVTHKPEVAKSIGMDGLRELKAETQELTERVPDLVEQRVNRDELWTHRKLPEDIYNFELNRRYSFNGYSAPSEPNDAVRHALGPVRELLVKHGFDEYDRHDYSDRRKYGYYFEWPEDMKSALQGYAALHKEYIDVIKELRKVEREKDEFEVKNMWDEA